MFSLCISENEQYKSLFMELAYWEQQANKISIEETIESMHVFSMVRLFRCFPVTKLKLSNAKQPMLKPVMTFDDYSKISKYVKERDANNKQLEVGRLVIEECQKYISCLEENKNTALLEEVDQYLWDKGFQFAISDQVDKETKKKKPPRTADGSESDESLSESEDEEYKETKHEKEKTNRSFHLESLRELIDSDFNRATVLLGEKLSEFQSTKKSECANLESLQKNELKDIHDSCQDIDSLLKIEFGCGKLRSNHPFASCFAAVFEACKVALIHELFSGLDSFSVAWKAKMNYAAASIREINAKLCICQDVVFCPVATQSLIEKSDIPGDLVKSYCSIVQNGDLSSVVFAFLVQFSEAACKEWQRSFSDQIDQRALDTLTKLVAVWADVLRAAIDITQALRFCKDPENRGKVDSRGDKGYMVSVPVLILAHSLSILIEAQKEIRAMHDQPMVFSFLYSAGYFPCDKSIRLLVALCQLALTVCLSVPYRLNPNAVSNHTSLEFTDKKEWDEWTTYELERSDDFFRESVASCFSQSTSQYFNKSMNEVSFIAWYAVQTAKAIRETNEAAIREIYTDEEFQRSRDPPFSYMEQVSPSSDEWEMCFGKRTKTYNGIVLPIRKKGIEQALVNIESSVDW